MLLSNLCMAGARGGGNLSQRTGYRLVIEKGRIVSVSSSLEPSALATEQSALVAEQSALFPEQSAPGLPPEGIVLSLPGALVFPGLINSHDHLDFNLYPRLGNRIYSNYTAWGQDIHSANTGAIREVSAIPTGLRTRWGLYKNLLNGFTTVVNHGVLLETTVPLAAGNELITVFQHCHNLHSVGFEKNWRWKLNRLSGDRPVALHVGEGTDAAAEQEIDRLIRWNFFKKRLIGIHGVAMNERQAEHFEALVWCPDSNYFLLDKTASVDRLKRHLTLLFGTDSTLTSGWNHWDQIRLARRQGTVTDAELLAMMTHEAAKIWGLGAVGEIAEGQVADLVIARPREDLFSLNPEDLLLVLHKGNVRLFDESLLPGLVAGGFDPGGFYKIYLKGQCKYVEGDLPGLIKEVRGYHPKAAFPEELVTE